ncbi:hypothetical protein WN48_01037 [Eufriesea mexicana]|nr:hypothetical protein WN48_01037 [Eufriesea mexicana]
MREFLKENTIRGNSRVRRVLGVEPPCTNAEHESGIHKYLKTDFSFPTDIHVITPRCHTTFFQNVDHGVVEPEEAEKSRSSRSSCNCVRCLISNRDSRVVDFSSTRRPRAIPNSTSSPAVSLPEVKTRPRTCPRSCSRISEARKQLDRYPARARSSSCCENVKSHEDTIEAKLTETRQEKCHEFAISGLHSTASSDDTCETESDHLEAFSVSRTRCLKKLSRPYAMKARAEIERILRSTSIKSKREDGIDPTLVDRSVTISIQPVSQSAGRTRTKMARFAVAKRRMRATQPVPDNGLSFDRKHSRKNYTSLPLSTLSRNAIRRDRVDPQSASLIKGSSKVVSNRLVRY